MKNFILTVCFGLLAFSAIAASEPPKVYDNSKFDQTVEIANPEITVAVVSLEYLASTEILSEMSNTIRSKNYGQWSGGKKAAYCSEHRVGTPKFSPTTHEVVRFKLNHESGLYRKTYGLATNSNSKLLARNANRSLKKSARQESKQLIRDSILLV